MVVDFVDTDIGQEQGSNTHRYVVQMYLNNFKTSTNCCQQQADDNKLRKKIDFSSANQSKEVDSVGLF